MKAAIDRGEAWLLEHLPSVRRANPVELYNSWAHAYGIQALVRLLEYRAGDEAKCRRIGDLIDQQIEIRRMRRMLAAGG